MYGDDTALISQTTYLSTSNCKVQNKFIEVLYFREYFTDNYRLNQDSTRVSIIN